MYVSVFELLCTINLCLWSKMLTVSVNNRRRTDIFNRVVFQHNFAVKFGFLNISVTSEGGGQFLALYTSTLLLVRVSQNYM